MVLTNRQKMDLDILAVTLELPMWRAVQANVVMWGARDIFAKDPDHKVFAMNPVNTFLYSALHALEDRSVVEIAEALKDEHRLIPVGMTIRGKAQLVSHRDAVSHTGTIRWRRPAMQAFFDAHKQWTDLRAGGRVALLLSPSVDVVTLRFISSPAHRATVEPTLPVIL